MSGNVEINENYEDVEMNEDYEEVESEPSQEMNRVSSCFGEELSEILAYDLLWASKQFPYQTQVLLTHLDDANEDTLPYRNFAKTLVTSFQINAQLRATRKMFSISKAIAEDDTVAWRLASALLSTSKTFPEVTQFLLPFLTGDEAAQTRLFCQTLLSSVLKGVEESDLNGPNQTNVESSQSSTLSGSSSGPSRAKIAKVATSSNKSEAPVTEMTSLSIENFQVSHVTESRPITVTTNLVFSRNIGKGAEGVVDAYLDTTNGKMYAIKQITCSETDIDLLQKQLETNKLLYKREAETLFQLDAKSLFTECNNAFLNSDDGVNQFCIQMPLYEMTIDQLARNARDVLHSQLFAPWFLSVLMQEVFEAVEIMHDYRFIHRDLKAGNIMVSFKGLKSTIKIGDFGFARNLNTRADESADSSAVSNKTTYDLPYDLTDPDKCGTPLYRCPVVEDEQNFTLKDDVYNLGLLYAELLLIFFFNPTKREFFSMINLIKEESCIPQLETQNVEILVNLIEQLIHLDREKRLPISEAKKLNLFVSFVLAFVEPLEILESKSKLDQFLNGLLGNKNSQLFDHYKNVFNTTLNQVLDQVMSQNRNVGRFQNWAQNGYLFENCLLKQSNLSSDFTTFLHELFNNLDIFKTKNTDFSQSRNNETLQQILQNYKLKKKIQNKFWESANLLLIVGHYLNEIYKNFAEATLLDFGETQLLVAFENYDFGLETLASNSNELLLKSCSKVALWGARWSGFKSFLTELNSLPKDSSSEHYLRNVITNLVSASSFNEAVAKILLSDQKRTKNLNAIWYVPPRATELDISKLLFADSVIKLDFKQKEINDSLPTVYDKYCRLLKKIYFVHWKVFTTFLGEKRQDEVKDIAETCFFAEAVFFQLKLVFLEESNKAGFYEAFNTNEFNKIFEVLKAFLWTNESNSAKIEKIRKLITKISFPYIYVDSEKNLKGDVELPSCFRDAMVAWKYVFQESSIFAAVSTALFGSVHFLKILKLLCLAEIARNYAFYRNKTAHFKNLLLHLVLKKEHLVLFYQGIGSELPKMNFDELILEMFSKILGKNIVVYQYTPKDSRITQDCLLMKTLPLCDRNCCRSQHTLYCKSAFPSNIPFCQNNPENCQCEFYFDKTKGEFSFMAFAQKDNSWFLLFPKWHQACLSSECGGYIQQKTKKHVCFNSYRIYRQKCEARPEISDERENGLVRSILDLNKTRSGLVSCATCQKRIGVANNFFQCMSVPCHTFCFLCLKVYLKQHLAKNSEETSIYCPSGKRCPGVILDSTSSNISVNPWTFTQIEIDYIDGHKDYYRYLDLAGDRINIKENIQYM